MSKFTPGPWVRGYWTIFDSDRGAQKRGEPFWTFVEGESIIARGPHGRKAFDTDFVIEGCGREDNDMGISDADARLVCAAPDMLEALKFYAAELSPSSHGIETKKLLNDRGRIAREAIAKAEGSKKDLKFPERE